MQLNRTSVLVAPVLILLLFAPTLAGIDRLAFRDVSHFYTPLYDYVASRCSEQWLPLWNPLDQTGIALAGETTTAVFYPLRYILFGLPIPSEVAISWYVVLHLILASLTARLAARWAGLGQPAAAFAGVLYPLSGSVLFLYTNPPYLVSAAWLPLALGALLSRYPLTTPTRIIVAGMAMSMMILGGDPQTALHAMMVASLVWAVQLLRGKRRVVAFGVLVAAPILAAALAAPQLAASISWSSHSERIRATDKDRWTDPPIVGGRRYEAYQYSVAPWHTLELATPNAFGTLLPTNARISRLFPGDGRTWTPSIYMGTLVLLVIVLRLTRLRSEGIDAWLAIGAVSLWLAMGHFGVVWLIQATTHTLPDVDSAIGGPYWWLYQFVPGYDSFRYPAKWLTLFSLGAAIVTAQVIEKELLIEEEPLIEKGLLIEENLWSKRLRPLTLAIGALLVVALAAVLLLRWDPTFFIDSAKSLPKDEFWGPLDLAAAFSQIGRSIVHSIIALLGIAVVFRLRALRGWSNQTAVLALLVIVAVDLSVSGRAMIARVSRDQEQALMAGLGRPNQRPKSRWMRTQTGGGWPAVWKQTQDDDRLTDVEASVRAAWFGRWHLEDRVSVLNNMVSIRSNESATFWKAIHRVTAGMTGSEREEFWASIRRWLSIDGVVHTSGQSVDVRIEGRDAQMVDRRDVYRAIGQPLRYHADWTHDESLERKFVQRLRTIAQSGGLASPTLQSKVADVIPSGTSHGGAAIETLVDDAERAEFAVRLNAGGLLTRPVFQDGHWVAHYSAANSDQWHPIPVHRVDLLTQGVLLPAGQWQLRFQYSPWWLGWSLAIAFLAWVFVLTGQRHFLLNSVLVRSDRIHAVVPQKNTR
jgi:hypothetical protein